MDGDDHRTLTEGLYNAINAKILPHLAEEARWMEHKRHNSFFIVKAPDNRILEVSVCEVDRGAWE